MRRNCVTVVKCFLFTVLVAMSFYIIRFHWKRLNEEKIRSPSMKDLKRSVSKRIDWHDYKLIEAYKRKTGPGEQGAGMEVPDSDKEEADKLYYVNGFNAYISDKISLHRALRDLRHPDCMKEKYSADLPTVSVVIPFFDEHWSTLLRTVYSVLNQSPGHLIKQIILVDDFSAKEFLKQKLDDYIRDNFNNVYVVRMKKREGLIRARLAGAEIATGEVLLFLDSHCEMGYNWLPPLLDPIAADFRTVVCPFIDVIDPETFLLRPQDEGARGAFDWYHMYYKRLPLLDDAKQHPSKPFDSPVMAGGLFAISRRWFWELGGYDPGLDIWGGEQYELSFKIWQCGGRMVDAPCSRVGHVYRGKRSHVSRSNPGGGNYIAKNHKRVAEVWMDEYKEYVYERNKSWRDVDAGNITAQIALRNRLQCKSFDWFMKEVAFDLLKNYPAVIPTPYASGQIRHYESGSCIYPLSKKFVPLRLTKCQDIHEFEYTWRKDIRHEKMCLDLSYVSTVDKKLAMLYPCHGKEGNQLWIYNVKTQQLYHKITDSCLDASHGKVYVSQCDEDSTRQKWLFSHTNNTMLMQLLPMS